MVLDPLGIDLGNLRRHTKCHEKAENNLVTLSRFRRQLDPFFCQEDAAIWLLSDVSIPHESLDCLADCHSTHP